jgi:hypothetical protein
VPRILEPCFLQPAQEVQDTRRVRLTIPSHRFVGSAAASRHDTLTPELGNDPPISERGPSSPCPDRFFHDWHVIMSALHTSTMHPVLHPQSFMPKDRAAFPRYRSALSRTSAVSRGSPI